MKTSTKFSEDTYAGLLDLAGGNDRMVKDALAQKGGEPVPLADTVARIVEARKHNLGKCQETKEE